MRATGPARVVLATLAALVTLVLAAGAVPAQAAPSRVAPGDPAVRLVVRTAPGAAAEVTAAAASAGATRVGRVRRLHAVSFTVPSRDAHRVRSLLERRADVASVGRAHRRWLTDEPADPRFAEQRTYLGAIGVPAAWDRGAVGSPRVTVAVIDSGVDVNHPDLAGKVAGRFNAVTGTADVRDVVGHGTGTASVAAAATGNGVGIAGSGRDTSLLAVKVADVTGRIFTDDLARGIVWATDQGADVVNLSLGGPTTDPLERAAVAYAVEHDVLVVAAAGNEGTSAKQFPGALPGVLAVGATTQSGSARASFSSHGSWVDLGAPGRSVLAATPGGGYESADGTSYSAPLVAGAAALLQAYRPGRTASDLRRALVGSTDGARYGFAHGLVHVDRALDLLPPASLPTLVSPADGSTVAGRTAVTVSTTAPRVRLSLGDQSATVSSSGGSAQASFATYGLGGGQRVEAVDCSFVDQCAAAGAAATVTVGNAAPTLTSPAPGTEVRDDGLGVTADAPVDAAVRFSFDGRTTGSVVDTAAPFGTTLPTGSLSDGPHSVQAVLCRADGTVCGGAAAEVRVTATRLHPAVTGLSPRALSPDGDGRRDSVTVTYRLDRPQTAVLQVRNASGRVVHRRSLGRQPAGTRRATWDGRRGSGGRGRVVDDGEFRVEISTSDGVLKGLADRAVTVDRSRPALRGVRPSARRVLPVRDRYYDAVTVSGTSGERLRRLTLQVRTRGGTLVRTVRGGRPDAGPVAVVWDGRLRGGRLVPGTYRVRLRAEDLAGNRARSATRTLRVTGQRLVRRSGSTTVSARQTLEDTFADDCSDVYPRTSGPRDGWVTYSSGSLCTSGDAYASGDHQVRLPAAPRYGTVRVSAYGARADRRYRDAATVVLYDGLQNLSSTAFRLGPSPGWYRGPRVKAGPLLIRSRVLRWETLTTGVAWYDVKTYRVDFSYFVLR